ncbi:EGF-like domain-containing protein [Tieghemostelium lacteum]|uniref:EGF-like domain-containing protein n=1 Tax=Tieghemostelium lacteum TaxID=361077 RepID=A0A152A486_TIELA|nr:EGF-like domain-containing protein [Tieghemostelium lacteum]|eukprot:KYR01050.1 EGF-like domain-containing protein [Tieghemostelium lacteum]
MRIFISSLLFYLCITGSAYAAQQCQQDYECGNFPYTGCLKGLNLIPGIHINDQTNTLYFMGNYNSSNAMNFGDPYIVSINTESGAITQGTELTFEIPQGGGGRTVWGFPYYIPQLEYFYIILNQIGSPILALLNNNGHSYSQIWNFRNVPLQMFFMADRNKTIQADFGINEFDHILTSRPANPDQEKRIIYRDIFSSGISVQGLNDLYLATFNGTFYKGTLQCTNCSQSQLVSLFRDQDLVNNSMTGFCTTDDYIYYSSALGLFSVPINGDYSRKRVYTSDPIISMTYSTTGFIYYTTTGNVIKKISLGGNHPQTTVLLSPSTYQLNQCVCNHGLTGDDCQTCHGQLLWDNNQPFCTTNDQGGNPSVCFYDWQCKNNPYSYCASGTCACRSTFTGDDCSKCDGQVVWDFGYPECKK